MGTTIMSDKRIIVIRSGETRIDILSKRVYGNSNNYKKLLQANPQLDIFNLKAGTVIEAPNNG